MPEDRDALVWLNRALKEFESYEDAVGNGNSEEIPLALGRARHAVLNAREQLMRERQQRG